MASLHEVDFAIAGCKVAGPDQAHNMHWDFSKIGQADIVYEAGHAVVAVAKKAGKAGQMISMLQNRNCCQS